MNAPRRLGVLGGMGPLATVDFLRKLVVATPAERDQDHLPLIVYSVPQVPDRVGPILRGEGPSPLPAMLEGIRVLEAAAVQAIAMPCITAHFWYRDLSEAASVPFLHVVDATEQALARRGVRAGQAIGLLATAATLEAGFIQDSLEAAGHRVHVPSAAQMRDHVQPGIAAVKRGERARALAAVRDVVERMLDAGDGCVVLACTELPLALEGAEAPLREACLDTVDALARACVDWARAR